MGFGAFLVTFCAGKKSPGVRGRGGPERLVTNNFSFPPPGEERLSPAGPEAPQRMSRYVPRTVFL